MQTKTGHLASGTQQAAKALRVSRIHAPGRGVLDALTALIEEAGLGIGDKLPPEIELAKRLHVGRSTIREALKTWQNMGIILRNKGAGTTIAAEVFANAIHLPLTLKIEAESLLRTHSVRRPLEIEAARLACGNATDKQRRIISARLAELLAVYEAGEDWRAADHKFHASIHEAAGNPLFGQLIRQIQNAFQDIYEAPLGQPHFGADSIPMHRDLAIAIVDGDADRAVQVCTDIMELVEVEVRKVVGEIDA